MGRDVPSIVLAAQVPANMTGFYFSKEPSSLNSGSLYAANTFDLKEWILLTFGVILDAFSHSHAP